MSPSRPSSRTALSHAAVAPACLGGLQLGERNPERLVRRVDVVRAVMMHGIALVKYQSSRRYAVIPVFEDGGGVRGIAAELVRRAGIRDKVAVEQEWVGRRPPPELSLLPLPRGSAAGCTTADGVIGDCLELSGLRALLDVEGAGEGIEGPLASEWSACTRPDTSDGHSRFQHWCRCTARTDPD